MHYTLEFEETNKIYDESQNDKFLDSVIEYFEALNNIKIPYLPIDAKNK